MTLSLSAASPTEGWLKIGSLEGLKQEKVTKVGTNKATVVVGLKAECANGTFG
jgi:hypothetical protein